MRSYEDLIARKYAESRSTNGTFIRDKITTEPVDSERSRASEKLAGIASEYSARLKRNKIAHATSGHLDALNFGAVPTKLLPSRRWRELLLNHCKVSTRLAYKPEIFGRLELRKVLAEYVNRTKGIDCGVEQIVVCSQSVSALNLLCRLLIDEGATVAIEEPGFGGIRDICIAHGASLQPIAVDDEGLDVSALAKINRPVRLAYVTPGHHDPTGAVLSAQRRSQLLQWAQHTSTWIIEDDYDGHFSYSSRSLPPLAALDKKGHVIHLGSFWKVLYPLTLVSFIVLPSSLLDLAAKAKALVEPDSEALEHLALADYIGSGQFERHLRRVRRIYAAQRRSLIYNLKQAFRDQIAIAPESGGSHQLVRFNVADDDDNILIAGLGAGLGIASTAEYYLGKPRRGEFIVDFSLLTPAEIEAAVEHFKSMLK